MTMTTSNKLREVITTHYPDIVVTTLALQRDSHEHPWVHCNAQRRDKLSNRSFHATFMFIVGAHAAQTVRWDRDKGMIKVERTMSFEGVSTSYTCL